ncbi:MAG TPA: hypothetical protein VFZ61_05445, partial [Polyangiales bacterium]
MTSPAYASAMSVQLARLHARLAQGMPRRGWKVGINVPEVQRALGLDHALIGWLDGERVLQDGAVLVAAPGSALHVEPELCLRLRAAVSPDADEAAAQAAVEGVAPALELVNYAQPRASLADVVGHSMFHHAVVVGAFRALDVSGKLAAPDAVTFRVGGVTSEPARAELVPARAGQLVLQVAARLAECGERLEAGDWLISGSYMARALPLAPG